MARGLIPAITRHLPSLRSLQTASTSSLPPPPPAPASLSHLPPILPSTSKPPLPDSVPEAISLLRENSTPNRGLYLLARLHARTYVLHPRDIITLPTLRPRQQPGTTLKLTRILEVGCRDYAIRAPASEANILRKEMDWDARELPTVPTDIVNCELTVLEHTTSPMETRFKMKRRKGYRRWIKRKQGWTRLRVGDILLSNPEATKA